MKKTIKVKMNLKNYTILIVALFPNFLFAHGQEVIAMPIGGILGLIISSLIFWHKNISLISKIILFSIALIVFVSLLFVPLKKIFIYQVFKSHFVTGFLPPVLITWGTVSAGILVKRLINSNKT